MADPTPFQKPDKRRKAHQRARLHSKDDRDARALVFMLERVKGKRLIEIAAEYNCSESTVKNYIYRAREHNLIANQAKHLIQDKLLPLTLAVYEAHLTEGNLEAAQDILFGLGILQKNSTVKHQASESDDLETWRQKFFEAKEKALDVAPPNPPKVPASLATLELPPGRQSDSLDQTDED